MHQSLTAGQRSNSVHECLRVTDLVGGGQGRSTERSSTAPPCQRMCSTAFRSARRFSTVMSLMSKRSIRLRSWAEVVWLFQSLGRSCGQSQQLSFLFLGQLQALVLARPVKFLLRGLEFFQCLVPASLQRAGHQTVGWIDFFVASLSQLGLIF